MDIELEFTLHEEGKPSFTAKALILPKDEAMRFALPDEPDELLTAAEFKAKLKTVHFEKGPEFVLRVVKGGKRHTYRLLVPPWPGGDSIRVVRCLFTLGLE